MILLNILKIKNTNKMEIENLMANDLVYYNEKPVRLNELWQDFLQNLQTNLEKMLEKAKQLED